jgi:hypothetical protein
MLSVRDGVNDARQFIGNMRGRDHLVFALMALMVILPWNIVVLAICQAAALVALLAAMLGVMDGSVAGPLCGRYWRGDVSCPRWTPR